MVFAWLDPLTWIGWKRQIQKSDLWSLRAENRLDTTISKLINDLIEMSVSFRCSHVVPQWANNWKKETTSKNEKKKKYSILPVLFKTFGPPYIMAMVLTLLLSVLQFAR